MIGGFKIRENYNDCVSEWYNSIITKTEEWKNFDRDLDGCVRIGIHLRWGDVATSGGRIGPQTKVDSFRSISINDINKAFSNLKLIGCRCRKIFIYIENSPGIEHNTFIFDDFTVVDTGNDLNDLIHYAHNDILIQGRSSFPVLGSFIISNKTVITNSVAAGIESKRANDIKYEQRFSIINHLFSPDDTVFHVCK